MDNDIDKWRNLFHQAQEYSTTSEGIIDELRQGGARYDDPIHINEGGMKDIYSVQDTTTGRRVALAVLKKESVDLIKENFLREARITAFLQHPNIMPVYDIGIDDENTPYFTMKLSRGESLQQIINKLRQNKPEYRKLYPLTALIQIFRKVCEAVASAHAKGVIHLDIKPDNIQISNYGEVLLCDWGLSKITNADIEAPESLSDMDSLDMSEVSSVTRHDEIKGTPGYMAPEQANPRKGRRDSRTDTFALGAVLYSLLTLELPFIGKTAKDITRKTVQGKLVPPRKRNPNREIPASLEAVVLKAMSRKPVDRYSSADEIIQDIESWQNGFATNAEEAGVFKQLILLYKRNTLFCNSLLASFVIIFGIFSFFLIKQRSLLNEISNKE
ncbi:MAG: serine/threonine protein kinase, partial [Lentisphaeraceae bacterium]|nr:serine/threonine protein kinase [Lentisphaeraceae bacterium]